MPPIVRPKRVDTRTSTCTTMLVCIVQTKARQTLRSVQIQVLTWKNWETVPHSVISRIGLLATGLTTTNSRTLWYRCSIGSSLLLLNVCKYVPAEIAVLNDDNVAVLIHSWLTWTVLYAYITSICSVTRTSMAKTLKLSSPRDFVSKVLQTLLDDNLYLALQFHTSFVDLGLILGSPRHPEDITASHLFESWKIARLCND